MIVLPSTNTSLQLILAGAITTNQLDFTVAYQQISSSGQTTYTEDNGTSNSGTAVTLVAVPSVAGDRRIIKSIAVHNNDTVSATVTIRYNDNGTFRTIIKVILATLENLIYEDGHGWQAFTTAGGLK